MESSEIRKKFLKFFEERDHVVVRSSSLVPENDSSVLFTTAGMQQFKPYYLEQASAEKDFGSLNTASVQKCLRTSDIEEVGDESHLTFFEMLGNFSFGGYWKKEAIQYAYDFISQEMGLKIDYVTVFEGDETAPADTESEEIWQALDPTLVVKKFGRADNFWGPTGHEGPCGPTTEIYVEGVEIWNIVFNEFYKTKDGQYEPLKIKGVDTGMGLERLAKVVQKVPTVFETDLLQPIINLLPKTLPEGDKRIIADHSRTVTFIISDGVKPSNTERGYVLRRLIRRVAKFVDVSDLDDQQILGLVDIIIAKYENFYNLLRNKNLHIKSVIELELKKFKESLSVGIKQIQKLSDQYGYITGAQASSIFSSYGVPLDIAREITTIKNEEEFYKEQEKHKNISTVGSEQKFKGGLAGHSEVEIKYHTATHLLHQALREVLGNDVFQKGSNITPERLRLDFSFPRKMTDKEKKQVEALVNTQIKKALPVTHEDISPEEAKTRGAIGLFEEKYGDLSRQTGKVRVYKIGDFSLEFCGGPHVTNTSVLGKFKISKEEATSTGVRRIRAILE